MPITSGRIEFFNLKNFQQITVQNQTDSQGNALKDKNIYTPIPKNFRGLLSSFYEDTMILIPKTRQRYHKKKITGNIFDEYVCKNLSKILANKI